MTDCRGPRFSAAQFVKFREIPQHYYPQTPYITQRVGVVVLADSTSKYKEFIETRNTKTHYIIFVHINIIHTHHVIHVIML